MEKKDAYYFSHDANARNDSKILKVRRVLGIEGYGIYFCLIEMLREQKDYKLPFDSLLDYAYNLNVSEEKLKSVVTGFDLFKIDENNFFSPRLLDSMEVYKSLSQKRIEAGKKGGQASVKQRLSIAQPNVNDCSTIKGNKRKENKKKLKEIKPKEIKLLFGEFVLLTEVQHKSLIEKFGEKITVDKIENLNEGIGSKGYKYDSHYHTILAWERKNNGTRISSGKRETFEKTEAEPGKYDGIGEDFYSQ